ncbi:MAG: LapA family protein [Chloroflexi bacterium]|nr:LapA family protein [Chloroflexota bacterium]
MYIDPNSGGMLFQILVVIFGVLSGAVLMFSSRIKMGIAKLRRTLRKKNEEIKTSEKQSESDQ